MTAAEPELPPENPEVGAIDPALLRIIEAMARADAERDYRDRLELRWVTE